MHCNTCGLVLRRGVLTESEFDREPVIHGRRPAFWERRKTAVKYLIAGAALAPVFGFTPILQFMGWFLASLFHETGHCAVAWAAGCPSFPAIRLDGHAAAVHGDQHAFLCVIVWGTLAWLAWQCRHRRRSAWVFGGLACAYPLIVFTGAREVLFLTSGHLGELAFATIAFHRALCGGFTNSKPERVLYAVVGWYLLGRNLWLTGGLMFDDAARAEYAGTGSFGLTNDYLRLANDHLHVGLEAVAALMFLVALAVLPIAWRLSRPS